MQTRRVQQKLNEVSARDSTDAFDGCCAWRGHDPISRMLTHCSLLLAVTQIKRTRSKGQALPNPPMRWLGLRCTMQLAPARLDTPRRRPASGGSASLAREWLASHRLVICPACCRRRPAAPYYPQDFAAERGQRRGRRVEQSEQRVEQAAAKLCVASGHEAIPRPSVLQAGPGRVRDKPIRACRALPTHIVSAHCGVLR